MPQTTQLVAFAVTAFVLILIPGPSVLFTVGRALSVGRRGALLTVLGNTGGLYVQVIAVALGVGAIVEASVEIYTVLKLAGGAYLVYLGVQAIRHRRSRATEMAVATVRTRNRRVLLEGFVVGLTNPKMIVFLAAALPQFVNRGAGQVTLQMLLLGLLVAAIAMGSDSLWAHRCRHGAHLVRRFFTPHRDAERDRRTGHDWRRREPGCHRPQGLTA